MNHAQKQENNTKKFWDSRKVEKCITEKVLLVD